MKFSRRKFLAGTSVVANFLPKPTLAWRRGVSFEGGLFSDGNLLNVRDYGATGNGTRDDTAAILAAIAALPMYSTTHNQITQIIYFPAGTYLVSDTIQRIVSGSLYANVILVGEDRASTIIKLADSTTGFTSSGSPKAVIALHSGNLYGQSPGRTGAGNEAFNNTIENLTLFLGTGNEGAIGVDWVVNNIGVIRNVAINTTGAAVSGISITRGMIGPGLISNVDISGPFAQGIDTAHAGYSITAEHITITGTTSSGIRNRQNVLAMRDITISSTSGYGIDITDATGTDIVTPWRPNEALTVWMDGVITGNGTAPVNGVDGSRNFSNVNVVNFNGSLNQSLDGVFRQLTQIGSPDWQLTVKNTPIPPVVPVAQWKKIVAPVSPTDATAAIQAALSDPTARVVYLPTTIYKLTGPIRIADNIERIEFLYSNLRPTFNSDYLFIVNATRTKDLFIRRLVCENSLGGISGVVHWLAPSPARLIMTDCATPRLFVRPSTGGEVYVENVNSPHIFTDGTVGIWMRQFNPEVTSSKISNTNAPLWILGLKTEQASSAVENDGGNVEIVGGYHFPGVVQTDPLFTNINDGRISAAYVVESLSSGMDATTEMTSTINGITNTVLASGFPQRGTYNGRVIAKLSTDDFVPVIQFSPALILPSARVGTAVATASLGIYNYSGTPVWSLTDDARGKYAINFSTGAVTVAGAVSVGVDNITIAVTGVTFGASGSATIALTAGINVTYSP